MSSYPNSTTLLTVEPCDHLGPDEYDEIMKLISGTPYWVAYGVHNNRRVATLCFDGPWGHADPTVVEEFRRITDSVSTVPVDVMGITDR